MSDETGLPTVWSATQNVRWEVAVPGAGSSSPIVHGGRVYLTTAFDAGARRAILCFDRGDGKLLWTCEVSDDWPEITSALTGYAASTPVVHGNQIVAFFGNAGIVCCDTEGRLLWRKEVGDFESELGLASSPIVFEETVIAVCDHDGDRFNSFDSFLIALDLKTGETRWKTERSKLYRSWSTPILVPVAAKDADASNNARDTARELVVAGQDELRGYDPRSGGELWRAAGLTAWVAPSPVCGGGLIFAASGKDGLTMAVRPGGRGEVSDSHVVWSDRRGSPYVSSPLLYGEYLYVANELGIVTCRKAATGEISWQRRFEGKFFASPVAGDGKIYLTTELGKTYVLAAGATPKVLAENDLADDIVASPAISEQEIFLRTPRRLYCIQTPR